MDSAHVEKSMVFDLASMKWVVGHWLAISNSLENGTQFWVTKVPNQLRSKLSAPQKKA